MPNEERALATIETILKVKPIKDADNIEMVQVRGWECVTKKGTFKEGDPCVYFEIDSVLPEEERYKFLSNSWNKRMQGYRIKTIRLRGQISQGLALPISEFPEIEYGVKDGTMPPGTDVTDLLNVRIYQEPEKGGGAPSRGDFPSHVIPKTDEERVQNVNVVQLLEALKAVYDYDGSAYMRAARDIDLTEVMAAEGEEAVKGGPFSPTPQIPGSVYYVSEKLDGSSMTIWSVTEEFAEKHNIDQVGIASRNKAIDYEKADRDERYEGSFMRWYKNNKAKVDFIANLNDRVAAPHFPKNFALQGELIGPGIQGNPYGLDEVQWCIFNLYDIDLEVHREVDTMLQVASSIGLECAPFHGVSLTPLVVNTLLTDRDEFQKPFEEDNPSRMGAGLPIEGRVFRPFWSIPRNIKSQVCFKVINNEYLLKHSS